MIESSLVSMHFAQKNMLAVLFSAGILLTSFIPKASAFSTSDKKPNPEKADTSAWVEVCSITDMHLTRLNGYIPDAKIDSYNLNVIRLNDMRSSKNTEVKKDKANYASKNVLESKIIASVEANFQEPVINTGVRGETQESTDYNLNAEILLNLVNEHRVKIGIAPLQKDDSLMQLASGRTSQLFDEIFVNGNMHAGFRALNLSYYATENIIYNRTEQGAFNWWLSSGVHRAAIQNPQHTHTGIACSGKTCAQIFTSFQPR